MQVRETAETRPAILVTVEIEGADGNNLEGIRGGRRTKREQVDGGNGEQRTKRAKVTEREREREGETES